MSQALALSYAALILQDDGIEISADKLQTIVEAAGVECESIWSNIFAKALQGKDLSQFFLNIGSAPAAAPASSGAAPAAATAEKVEEKVEEKEESDEDMGFGLFD